jgi:hypothetical protein
MSKTLYEKIVDKGILFVENRRNMEEVMALVGQMNAQTLLGVPLPPDFARNTARAVVDMIEYGEQQVEILVDGCQQEEKG